MPSSSTNYSYDIPTVGSDSTTYGTIINQFVNSLSTKLKAVSDAINTAGVGASSTLAQINRNIAQVDAINSRLPTGVADLLPDPYGGSLTPVSTWPYLNTELTAEGFSPPTTAQEVLDFDYEGFATYLNTRFDSLSARIVGLDAPITIADSSTLVCETNAILDTIGEYKTVVSTQTTTTKTPTSIANITLIQATRFWPFASEDEFFATNSTGTVITQGLETVVSNFTGTGSLAQGSTLTVPVAIGDILSSSGAVNGNIGTGQHVDLSSISNSNNISMNLVFRRQYGFTSNNYANPLVVKIPGSTTSGLLFSLSSMFPNLIGGKYAGPANFLDIGFVSTTTSVSSQVKKTINDVDFSGCT